MFVGRKEELAFLEKLYRSDRFEFLVLYGRRRIGKTSLLREFGMHHECIFFSGMQKNDPLNLADFSRAVQLHFASSYIAPFPGWNEAFEYIAERASEGTEKTVLIIDEFPFLAEENPTVKSILQHQIDKSWCGKNIMLVLCGSNISFMESEVMGEKSPLYGRSTAQLEVKAFDYLESSLFFPHYSEKEKLIAYGILGGVPRYLMEFDPDCSLVENIRDKILTAGAFLNEEPYSLLRMEVRETAVYNSILQSVAGGINRVTQIASAIHEDATKVNKYISTLQSLRLLEKTVPCGENPEGRKGIWRITDNYLNFWYRYEFSNRTYYDLLGPEKAAAEIWENINEYMGPVFEKVSESYLMHRAKDGRLPFVPYSIGRWWGNNPAIKAQDDVDVLALDRNRRRGIFAECKFTNRRFNSKDLDDVLSSLKAFPSLSESYIYVFSISGCTEEVEKHKADFNMEIVDLKALFEK